jgi:L-threonylcarbamoyladenylate synthase
MTQISKDIMQAAAILKQDGLVSIPTETVYGLAGNVFSEKAIKTIFEMKNRPFFNPLIVHIHDIQQLDDLVEKIPEKASLLAKEFWPGPLTMVLKKKKNVPNLITAGKDTVAVRMPNHETTLDLLRHLDFPLAAPSANPFGAISPTKAIHVATYFHDTLPMVLDGGDCAHGIESTIIGFENEVPILYRLGAISQESIEKVIGTLTIKNNKEEAPEAPGMLSKHYAPSTPTYLENNISESIGRFSKQRIGVLTFKNKVTHPMIVTQEVLSEKGDLDEAASNLYAALHRLDKMNLDTIIAERFPDYELGKSINDRLERATKK